MELKFIIFAIIILGNGCLIVSGDSEEQLKETSQIILNEVNDLLNQFEKLQNSTFVIVAGNLQQNPDIQRVLAFRDASSQAHNITADRSACIDNSLRLLSINLYKIVLEEILKNLTSNSNYFADSIQTLKDIRKAVDEDVQVEIESCFNNNDSCKITGEFLDKTQEYFQFIDVRSAQVVDALKRNWAAFESRKETKDKITCDFLSVECVLGS